MVFKLFGSPRAPERGPGLPTDKDRVNATFAQGRETTAPGRVGLDGGWGKTEAKVGTPTPSARLSSPEAQPSLRDPLPTSPFDVPPPNPEEMGAWSAPTNPNLGPRDEHDKTAK